MVSHSQFTQGLAGREIELRDDMFHTISPQKTSHIFKIGVMRDTKICPISIFSQNVDNPGKFLLSFISHQNSFAQNGGHPK